MVSRNYDLSQTPSDSILIFPDVPASPPSAGSFLGAVTSSTKLAQLGFFAPGAVYIPIAGGTMTGPLILSGDPIVPLGAVTKQYSDTRLPLAGGQMSGPLSLAGDPTQPLHAVTKQYSDLKLLIAGGTMTGNLFLNADPTSNLQAATKRYTDNQITSAIAGTTNLYLPLAGGTLTGPLTVPAVNTSLINLGANDAWGTASYEPSFVWSIRDSQGNVALALSPLGELVAAAVTTPTAPTMPMSKAYADANYIASASGGTVNGSLTINGVTTVRSNATFDSPMEPGLAFSVRDGSGNVAFAVALDGTFMVAGLQLPPSVSFDSATIRALTYTDLISSGTNPDWVNALTYDWTISDGTHIAGGLLKDGRLKLRPALETQTLTLTGTNLATAYQLDPCIADIKVCPAGGGVQLKSALGSVWYVQNSTSAAISVWPAASAQLGTSAIGSPITLEASAALIVWQSSLNKYAVAQAGSSGGGAGYVFTGTGFYNPRDLRDRVADTVNINDLVAGVDPSGVIDNSTQIKAAHDLAYNLGYRYIRFPARSKINAPFGGSASASLISNVIFTGEKCSINTYRKVIADPDGQRFTIPCDITPDQMTTFTTAVRAATTVAPARVVMIGHSGINASNFIQRGERWGAMLKQKLATEYSNRPIQVVDRSIGGTAWPDFARNGPPLNHYGNDSGNPVLWASDYNRRWIEYIKDLQPVHAIYFQFGANDNGKLDVYAIQAALDEIAATFSPIPTIFATADFGRQIQDSFSGTYTAQEAQEFMHGIQRTLFRRKGLGFFDLGRMMNVYRDGYDDRDGIMNNFIDNFGPPDGHTNQLTTSMPWSYPSPTLHFSVQINFGAMTGIFTSGRKIVVQIGNHPENILILERDGATNMIAFTVQTINQSLNFTVLGRDDFKGAQGPYQSVPRTLSQFNCSVQTNLQVYIDVHDALLTLVLASSAPTKIEQAYSMLVDRYGGYFTPSFAYDTGTSSTITINQAASYQPNTYVPQVTDYEFLDSTLHFTRFVFAKLWTPVTNAARFV